MITVTPLSASASSSSSSEPVCYLLELDEARILLDMGQRDYRSNTTRSSFEYEERVRELAPSLSLVLLSHSTMTYLGLYPYARAHWGLTCPVYATQPTVEMGRVVCLAETESWRSEVEVLTDEGKEEAGMDVDGGGGKTLDKGKKPLRGPFVPTVEQIHEAFDHIKPVRYNQPLHLGGDLSHLLLTPFPSGHTLGGTLFKLRSPTSGTILYALGINHTSERHLDGIMGVQGGEMGYDEGLIRPDLLIIEGGRAEVINVKRKNREAAILDLITNTLESSQSVLIPTDPSPRLLELLVLLDQHWTFKSKPNRSRAKQSNWSFPLCLVSKTAQDMLSFARSLMEWMGGMMRDAENGETAKPQRKGRRGRGGDMGSEYGILDFKHVQFFASPTDLLQAHPLSRPKVVLAIPTTLSHGPSRWLFTAIAGIEGNVILLTSRGEDDTLTRDLFNVWEESQTEDTKWGKGKIGNLVSATNNLQIDMNSKVPLMGVELEAHLEAERLSKEREAASKAAAERSRRMLEADDLDSDSDSEAGSDEEDSPPDGIIIKRRTDANVFAGSGDAEGGGQQMSFDIFVKGQQTRNAGRSIDGGMSRFRMFPFIQRMGRKLDDYGEGLDIGQWVRKGREIEEEGETEEVRVAKKRKAEEDEKKVAPIEPPSKYVVDHTHIQMKASIFYVDMEGLHDGQSIKTIIADLQPRKIVIVRSAASTTQSLISALTPSLPGCDILHPGLNETIRIGEHVQSYSLILGDSITSGLSSKWAKYEGFEVIMIDGRIALAAGSTIPRLESSSTVLEPIPKPPVEEKEETSDIMVKQEPDEPPPIIEPLPIKKLRKNKGLPKSLFVGDLRLAALRLKLNKEGIPAEFAGEGVLICGPGISQNGEEDIKPGSIVVVRKAGEGDVSIEGNVGKLYMDVRKVVYGCLAMVTAA